MPRRDIPLVSALMATTAALLSTTPVRAGFGDQPGSLLIYPNVEVRWDAAGNLVADTVITLSNNRWEGVRAKLVFVNGDPPLAPQVVGNPPQVVERSHPGYNRSGCTVLLDWYESRSWSAQSGQPGACSVGVLDPGLPPGRPDPENPGHRVLRGFLYIWAVDANGREIRWNHLSGSALLLDYQASTGWEYPAQSFRALAEDHGDPLPEPGVLRLDGVEYEAPPAELLLNFWPSGTSSLLGGAMVDTDLTLMPVSQDFRQDGDGCVTTKARFSITNSLGVRFSGTERCITCWDQTLLSAYNSPNHFLAANLNAASGTAWVDGVASSVVCGPTSVAAALTGVAVRRLAFTAPAVGGGDWNEDGALDLVDFRALQACLVGSPFQDEPSPGQCLAAFDLDRDQDLDLVDLADFTAGFGFVNRSYTPILLIGQGQESAIIQYDVPLEPWRSQPVYSDASVDLPTARVSAGLPFLR